MRYGCREHDSRGKSGMIVSDNGTEFTSNAILGWAKDHRVTDPWLMASPADRVYYMIHSALYDDEPVELTNHESQLHLHFSRFQVSPPGFDAFNGWYILLVEDRLFGRLIWRTPQDTVHEARIGAGEIDRVIDEFLTQLEKISGQTRKWSRP